MILTHHNQSHATQYTQQRFHTSHDSLMLRCYNISIETNFLHSFTHITQGRNMPHKDTHRDEARQSGTYDVYIEIDCDCQELLDAVGLDYEVAEDDDTQNEVCISLNAAEFTDVFDQSVLSLTNEQTIATALLNHELGEYTTKVTVYTPTGDKITFE